MLYNDIIQDLKKSVCSRLTQENKNNIKNLLRELKKQYGFLISTKFLRNLAREERQNDRTTTNLIYRLLKDNDIKTKVEYRFYREFNTTNTTKTKERLKFLIV